MPSSPRTGINREAPVSRSILVPDFTRRLTKKLSLPFEAVVMKTPDNEPQKMRQTGDHQYKNPDGVFEIKESVPPGPVLLLDDVFDSGWTLTIVAILLRKANSGPVCPCAPTTASVET